MKSFRIIAVACATLFVACFSQAQIKKGASSLGLSGSFTKMEDSKDMSAYVTYGYFMTDNLALDIGVLANWNKSELDLTGLTPAQKKDFESFSDSKSYGASLDLTYYFSNGKVAPYFGVGGSMLKFDDSSFGTYRAFTGFETFTSEKTSLDIRLIYEAGKDSFKRTTLRFGFKVYFD